LASPILVVHERIGSWSRQLRPRLAAQPVRLIESRSATDLEQALRGAVCPLVLIDLGARPVLGLDDLDRAVRSAPDALALVLDAEARLGLASLARELGASHVISGPAPPPAVAALLSRWICLAQVRAKRSGWACSPPERPAPEPWNWLNPLLATWTAGD
jgi:DNA-binding NtrC family response regulator